jgi:glycosyltransferase involved in cell wall biosynthesis
MLFIEGMPRPRPKFSVVMPAYNAANTIRAAISSVLTQTRQDFELIVGDDESQDETLQIVREFADSRIRVLACRHGGLAATRNAAADIARGKYVSFLDSDDVWLPTYLDAMGTALDQDSEAGIAYGDAWMIDDATRRIGRCTAMTGNNPPIPPPTEPSEFLARLLGGNFVFVSATVRRSVLHSVGGFDVTLSTAADYDLWLRIVARGHRAVRPPGIHAIYRRRRGSLSTNQELMLAETVRIYRKLASDNDLPGGMRDLAARRATAVAAELESRRHIRGRLAATRGRLGNLKAKVLWRRDWYARPPEEVSTVFPDLRRL